MMPQLVLPNLVKSVVRRSLPKNIASFFGDQRSIGVEPSRWDKQYSSGAWDFLKSSAEMPRYGVIASYCRSAGPDASVFDIGCGIGLLLKWLPWHVRYLGIDVSEAAIRQARENDRPRASFEVANAVSFDPGERFDVVVLNELLYYVECPELLVDRCAGFLRAGGVIVVSMYKSIESMQTWRRCAAHVNVLDQARIARYRGQEWTVRLCRLARSPGTSPWPL
jgi:2-polyprenyl-3-methyl-5-hydroxy-6-metoxy-1,4-benzoquinol methylase